jgi:hypothetical protein
MEIISNFISVLLFKVLFVVYEYIGVTVPLAETSLNISGSITVTNNDFASF